MIFILLFLFQDHGEHPEIKRYPAPGPAGPDRMYMRIAVHPFKVVEGFPKDLESKTLESALKQASKVLGHSGYEPLIGTEWMVITDGDMDRSLDYQEPFHIMHDFSRVAFKILFDRETEHLTLQDFKVYEGERIALQTSIGIARDGAAILGSLTQRGQDGILVVTFQLSKEPFPGQSTKARFTVRQLK